MESKVIDVKIHRNGEVVKMQFIDFEVGDIVLTDASNNDLKAFFDKLFDHIIESKKMIYFNLNDEGQQDLFHDVSNDIIQQLNSEIKQSENNFSEIFVLES